MKPNNYIKIYCLSCLLCCSFFANAQKPKPCGRYEIDTLAFKKVLKFEKENVFNRLTSASVLIRVYFHIVANNDGSNPAATLTQINSEFNTLVSDYAPDNICFLNCGVNQVNNTQLDTSLQGVSSERSLFTGYLIPNCLNIFYLNKYQGTNPACTLNCGIGGLTFKIPDIFTTITSGNIGAGQTISHEVGHCLGLLHTFETANGYEDIDGSNSSTAADLITDTPADPYAYNNISCYSTSSNQCTYTGSCTDPKGKSNFSPPYTNLMAYWWPHNCYSSLGVTKGQYSRVNAFLFIDTDLKNCESPSSVTLLNQSIISGYYMQSAVNTLNTSGFVIISGTANATLGGATVLLEPGFYSIPSNGGLVLVRPETCGRGGLTAFSKENKIATNESSPLYNTGKINSLIAYPNPTSSLVNLVFNFINNEDHAVIKVYDINLKIVKEVQLGNLQAGKHTLSLNLDKLSSGIYYVDLQLSHSYLKATVIVAK